MPRNPEIRGFGVHGIDFTCLITLMLFPRDLETNPVDNFQTSSVFLVVVTFVAVSDGEARIAGFVYDDLAVNMHHDRVSRMGDGLHAVDEQVARLLGRCSRRVSRQRLPADPTSCPL